MDNQVERRKETFPRRKETRLYSPVEFHRRLTEELMLAEQKQLPLSLLVIYVPGEAVMEAARVRQAEIALRLQVRAEDLLARLTEGILVVSVLKPAEVAKRIAVRLTKKLSQIAGVTVTSGIATYPTDAVRPLDLLRIAAWQTLSGLPRDERVEQIERLLGRPPVPALGGRDRAVPARQALQAYRGLDS